MLTSLLLIALAAAPAPCSLSDGSLPENSTLADQFTCYKNAGIKVSIPGTVLVRNGISSKEGCILGVAGDRLEVGECGPFPRVKFTIQYSSVRAVVDVPNERYVVIELEPTPRPRRIYYAHPRRPTSSTPERAEPHSRSLDMVRPAQPAP